MSAVATAARATARFVADFFVGDTPELFVASLAVVGIAFGVASNSAVACVVLPAAAVVALGLSAARGRRDRPRGA